MVDDVDVLVELCDEIPSELCKCGPQQILQSSDAVGHERHYDFNAWEYTKNCCVAPPAAPPVTTTA